MAFVTTPLDRSSLVVGAWRYVPAWALARLATTAGVIALAWWRQWPVMELVAALALQMAALYAVDFLAQRRFSRMVPHVRR
jgi:predicted PurR-regulated permease PerM